MKSMTGYSKLSFQNTDFNLNMELKSVNNKNLNLKIKLPYELNYLEGNIRNYIGSKISRGSIDLRIEFYDLRENEELFVYDKIQSKNYMKVLEMMEDDFGEKFTNKLDLLIKNLNIIRKNDKDIDEEEYTIFIMEKLEEIVQAFILTREEEGKRLKKYLLERYEILKNNIVEIKGYKEQVVENYKIKLLEKLSELDIDKKFTEEDILKEILLFTDKADISEEISRLESHLFQLRKEFENEVEPVGRKIDFIIQEIFRELNTTGVKSNFYEISKLVVESKNELEKIREQVLNIE